jgi:hypothetical protein
MGLNQKKTKNIVHTNATYQQNPNNQNNVKHQAPPNQCTNNQNKKISYFSTLLSYAQIKYTHCSFQDQAAVVNTSRSM